MQPTGKSSLPRRGFSLVELLVVIGIIALLIAILLPAMSHAREQSKQLVCLSNLRQMVIAANAYASTYGGYYPIAYYFDGSGTTTYSYCWDLTTIAPGNLPPQVVPGLLWDGPAPEKIQQCPSFDGASNWDVDPYTGYNYNTSFIGHGQYEAIVAPAKATQIHHTSTVAIFGDGQYAAGADKFMRAPFPNPGDDTFYGRWSGTQGFRHLNKTNVAFCDGHAESLSNRFTANQDGATNVAPGTGFLSVDNSLYGADD
jgi:prepilin-type N-terminal cleavage/methylation domain-containing protein/prepilin-type processing-associated H-X9-DG protein